MLKKIKQPVGAAWMLSAYSLKLLPLIILLLIISPITAQNDTPAVGVLLNTDAVSEGYILYSATPENFAYLIDNDGKLINQWQSDLAFLSLYLLENGDLLATVVEEHRFPAGGTGQIHRYDWDGNLLWVYDFEQAGAQIHHDIALLPNGNILATMWETITPDDFATYGIDPTLVPEDDLSIYFDNILEIDPTTKEIVWQWRMLDHSVQDYDDTLGNYGIPAANPHLIDINYSHQATNVTDRSHINAITYHPEHGQIMVSAHFQSEIWIIDHATDNLIYRWGNPQAYGRGLPEERLLFNQHNPMWLENGNIIMFNNGTDDSRRYSTILEMTPPINPDGTYPLLDGAAYAPNGLAWEYRAEPQETFFARAMSGAQRLANGNTFITDGTNGRLFEIDSEGNIVWEYLNPLWFQLEPPSPTSIFRATRYLPDYPAFDERSLTPQGQLEFSIFRRES